jgi:hypothetical protein
MGFTLEYIFLIGEKCKRHCTNPREHRAERNGKLALAQKIHGDKFGNHGNQGCQSSIKAVQQPFLIFKIDILKGFGQMLDHP